MIEVMTSYFHLAPQMPFSWKHQVNNLQEVASGTRWQPYPPVLLLTEACRFESHSPAKANSPARSPLLNQGYSTFL